MKLGTRIVLRLKKFDQEDLEINRRLCKRAILFVLICFMIFSGRLWYLQIVKGAYFRAKSERNRIKYVRIQAPRGKILDRSGRLLAGIKPSFNVCVVRKDIIDAEELIIRLSSLLNIPQSEIRARLFEGTDQPEYTPVIVLRGADWGAVSRVEAHLFELPGVSVEVSPGRKYPYGSVAPQLLGYLGEVSLEEIKERRYPKAMPGDLVGKCGVEARFESELSGLRGQKRLEVDAMGRLVRVVDERAPVPGQDVYLTIDLDLQQAAEKALSGKVGAVVAMDPNTGAILAMASSPGFDLGAFAKGISKKEWSKLNDKIKRPLQNKAIQDRYAPGSTFKIVMAAAALQEHIVDPSTTFFCRGSLRLGRRIFRCWDWRGHGQTNLYKALVESCDVYFYNVGLRLGIDKIAQYARAFGLGEKTGIDLPGESPGLVPTRQWKLLRFKEPWQKGETLNISIGQGFTLVTPLQMARMMAAIANNGTLYRPFYLDKIVGIGGTARKLGKPLIQGRLPVNKRHLGFIKRALVGVVEDKKGTGRMCRIRGITVAGKTGTAQVIKQAKRRQSEKMAWKFKDHAWFIAYAPAGRPQLAVAVLVEHGGHGGSAAAPIAKAVFERWFQILSPRPLLRPEKMAKLDVDRHV